MLSNIEKLKNILSILPGIGSKSALRLALFLMNMSNEKFLSFIEDLKNLKLKTLKCDTCNNFAEKNPCNDCQDSFNTDGILCIVENPEDTFPLKIGLNTGLKFHVLGGKLSPINGVSSKDLNIDNLVNRIDNLVDRGLKEIIIATSADVEGETTAVYLHEELKKFNKIKISRIAYGLSVGSSISQADEVSVHKSILSRTFY